MYSILLYTHLFFTFWPYYWGIRLRLLPYEAFRKFVYINFYEARLDFFKDHAVTNFPDWPENYDFASINFLEQPKNSPNFLSIVLNFAFVAQNCQSTKFCSYNNLVPLSSTLAVAWTSLMCCLKLCFVIS